MQMLELADKGIEVIKTVFCTFKNLSREMKDIKRKKNI